MSVAQSQYEKFQQWLNDCPVKISDYQDFTDQFQITFDVELEEENDTFTANDVGECISNGTDYSECVDHLVNSMNPTFHMDQAFKKLAEDDTI
tara:strand:+ start:542 stop:820 length:279 start_codon:yes stop_codon:yes gene_type:complete